MDKVIYTALFGNNDELKNIPASANWDSVVFTDNPELPGDCFEVIVCSPSDEDAARNSRFYKINSHKVLPDYKYSLWRDARIEIEGIDVDKLFDQYLKAHDLALHAHPVRNCIYEEAEICIQKGKDNPAVIRRQMDSYLAQGYPKGNGLASCGIIFRRHTPEIAQLNNAWWQEIVTHSRRDQLSFNYVAWRLGFDYFVIHGHVRRKDVKGFRIHPHKRGNLNNWQRSLPGKLGGL